MTDHTQNVFVDYPWEKVFDAAEKAVSQISEVKIESINVNRIIKSISLKTGKATYPGLTTGENITVSLEPISGNQTKIHVLSAPKSGTDSRVDGGKNRENINLILDEISKCLE